MDAPRGVQGPGRKLSPGGNQTPPGVATLVNDFAVKGEIEAVALDLVRDPQADDGFDDREDDDSDDCVINDDGNNADALVDDLVRVALHQAGVVFLFMDRQYTHQKRTRHPADPVDAEAVER